MKKIQELQERFPNWTNFNKNLTRNYTEMVIGGSEAYWVMEALEYDSRKILNLTLPSQGFTMCREVLRHFFSIIGQDGKINFLFTEKELLTNDSKNPLLFHYTVLHHWLYPMSRRTRLEMRFCYLFQPLWVLRCFGWRIKERSTIGGLEDNIALLKDIFNFCMERQLNFRFVTIKPFSATIMKRLEKEGISVIPFSEFEKCTKK